jgi:hypothetical protein
VLGEGAQDQISNAFLRSDVADRAQQRKRLALAVDGLLARRKRDVPAAARALPD